MSSMRSLLLLLYFATLAIGTRASTTVVMDASGTLNRQIPDVSTANGVVAVISSPGTPSALELSSSSTDILSMEQSEDGGVRLVCRGTTLHHGASAPERTSLATTALVAGVVIVDGITEGDVEMGLRSSRHARTLTALIRPRLVVEESGKVTLILGVVGPMMDDDIREELIAEVKALFDAAAAEVARDVSFEDLFSVMVVSIRDDSEARQILAAASREAKNAAGGGGGDSGESLSKLLFDAQAKVRETGVAGEALDPPHVAQAFLSCRQSFAKQARAARARVASWRSRAARGLTVDGFGSDAEALIQRTLAQGYDAETLACAGIPLVSPYRLELRVQLQMLVESAIRELFAAQVENLQKSTLKRFKAELLRRQGASTSEESAFDDNAAALRNAAYSFDSAMDALQVPSLGLTKEKVSQEMNSKLNDALVTFPDSPEARLKRLKEVSKVTSKERKPSQRAIDVGLDLVAMIRPDGFGSLQGFAGYQLGGNSITVGVHNDADDPQVIAQFGGVRPPLLRVQPKLRVDMEL